MVNVAAEIQSAIKLLELARRRLDNAFEDDGGRGVELADELDRVIFAIDSLNGELHCLHCSARLTSGRECYEYDPERE